MLLINDLRRHSQRLSDVLSDAVANVLKRGWYVLGSQVEEFEREFASYCQVEHCSSVANRPLINAAFSASVGGGRG